MPLAKGFLQARIRWDWFSRWAVGVFAIIGISYSFSLYAFAVVVREVMRFFTAHLGLHEFLQLTKDQEIFYNFWLAELALVFGLATVSQPLVLQLVPRGPTQQRLAMSHDQHSLMWFGLFALAKTMVLYGMLAPVIPIFLSFEFYQFKFILLALPLVLFLNQWLSINRVFKRVGMRVMIFVLCSIVLIGGLFSIMPPIPLTSLDRMIIPKYPDSHYSTQLPEAPTETVRLTTRYSIDAPLGIGFSRDGGGKPVAYVHNFPYDSAASANIETYLNNLKSSVMEYERDEISARLFIDRNVPMKNVKALRALLNRLEIRRAMFAVASPDHVTRFNHNTFFKPLSQPNCDVFFQPELYNDSTENDGIYLAFCEEIADPPSGAAFAFVVTKRDQVFFNGTLVEKSVLYASVISFFQRNSDGVLHFLADDETTFGQYIAISNAIMKANYDDRDPWFLKNYGFTYRETRQAYYNNDYQEDVYTKAIWAYQDKYPNRLILEMTDLHREYLLKKSPQLAKYFP